MLTISLANESNRVPGNFCKLKLTICQFQHFTINRHVITEILKLINGMFK